MLSRRKELQSRAGRKQLEGSLAQWCGIVAVTPEAPRAICRAETAKHKISIKQYRIKQGHKHSKSQPLNFFKQNSVGSVPLTQMEKDKTGRIVNFTFSYGCSSSYEVKYPIQSIQPSQSMKSISIPQEPSQNLFKFASQQTKLSRHASACYISQDNQPIKDQITERIITVMEHQNNNEGLHGMQRFQSTSMLAHTDGEEDDCWQGSTTNKGANEGSSKGLDDNRFFSRPQIKNFQRGDLFNAVKRSQTLKNDYQSESETSQVLQDYKSLMSKIQQNGMEEQLQQI